MPAGFQELRRSRAIATSTARITASALGAALLSAACDTYNPAAPGQDLNVPAEIQLSADGDTLDPTERTQITAVVLSAGGDTIETELTWSSDSVIVAEVDDDGLVTPRNSGEVSITAATRDVEASISLYIPPPLRFIQVSAGASTSCALTEDGATYCWGYLADKTSIPTRVAPDFVFEQITANDRTACGLTSSGDAYCWGQNRYYRIGESVPSEVEEPVRIDHPTPFRYINLGAQGGMCAIEETGTLLCWGHNDSGQVGRGTKSSWELERLPVAVDARFSDVSLGYAQGCGLSEDGQGYCWGQYVWGIGDGVDVTQDDSEEADGPHPPVEIAGELELISIETGHYFSCAVTVDNRGYCWGMAEKLGTGDTEDQWAPAEIPEHRFSEIATGFDGACGLTTGGEALCWGGGSLPEPLPGGIEFQQLSAGSGNFCGISMREVVYCWGEYRLGRNDMQVSQEPVPIMWPAGIGAD